MTGVSPGLSLTGVSPLLALSKWRGALEINGIFSKVLEINPLISKVLEING